MPLYVTFRFVDNNGKAAETRMALAQGLDFAAILAFAGSMAALLQGISDARLTSYTISQSFEAQGPFPTPSPDSAKCKTLLFYRNGDDTASIALPGRTTLPVDTDGPYAGVRVSRSVVSLSGMLPALDALLLGALDPTGRPYGNSFSVGLIIGEGV